ncbi:hypothetical protein [Kingella sp. (in: b-proteobacteria)]|nr:hypothetical protein [Kingella sp. (in: b-proteobacteria)]MDO4656955.1 hypothetical protein [Kingella sp. (in: b-proteobacteria)]
MDKGAWLSFDVKQRFGWGGDALAFVGEPPTLHFGFQAAFMSFRLPFGLR